MSDPERMPAEFGLATATFVIVASMVGVGILTISGLTVYFTGSNQLMLILWVVGGVIAVCGALTICELTAALPQTGGDYVFLNEAYGPVAAFLSGWVSFLIGFSAPSAAAAFGAAKYLLVPLHLNPVTAEFAQRCLATTVILGFALLHTTGRKGTAHVQGWITSGKVVFLVLFAVAGLAAGWPHFAHFNDRPPLTRALVVTMFFSLVYVNYAYIGWNAASYLAGEVVAPQKTLPRAILLGTGGVTILYLCLNVVYGLGLSAGDVQALVNDPGNTLSFPPEAAAPIAQLAARRLFGAYPSDVIAVTIGLMLLSSLSAYLLAGPRVIYAMAAARQFPRFAARLTRRSGTPAVATVLQVAATIALLWTGSFVSIVEFAGVGLTGFSILAISAIYVLRWKRPDLPRPFRTPGYPVTPAIYILLTLALTAAMFSERPRVSLYALFGILAGVPLYYLTPPRRAGVFLAERLKRAWTRV